MLVSELNIVELIELSEKYSLIFNNTELLYLSNLFSDHLRLTTFLDKVCEMNINGSIKRIKESTDISNFIEIDVLITEFSTNHDIIAYDKEVRIAVSKLLHLASSRIVDSEVSYCIEDPYRLIESTLVAFKNSDYPDELLFFLNNLVNFSEENLFIQNFARTIELTLSSLAGLGLQYNEYLDFINTACYAYIINEDQELSLDSAGLYKEFIDNFMLLILHIVDSSILESEEDALEFNAILDRRLMTEKHSIRYIAEIIRSYIVTAEEIILLMDSQVSIQFIVKAIESTDLIISQNILDSFIRELNPEKI